MTPSLDRGGERKRAPKSNREAALSLLQEVFGHSRFRAGQEAPITAVLEGRDAVVLLPTGGGKSACYQVPGLVKARRGDGTTLVVSPLIALMKDQVDALRGRGVQAAAINSHQEEEEQRRVVKAFLRQELEILYVSPERAGLESFKRMLARVRVGLLAIDEAHCLSQWGHDFRPEYLRLNELRPLAKAPTIALTATATPRVMREIVKHLSLHDPEVSRGDFRRLNLRFLVFPLAKDAERTEKLINTLERAGLRSSLGQARSIVYCSTRKKTEAVAKALKAAGFAAGYYHAGRTKLARERAQRAFELRRTRVLVATNAFGMGVDYPDVRVIVHYQTPGSVEAYYQEAGRAGRDGQSAECHLFFGVSDLITQRRLGAGGKSLAGEQAKDDALAAMEHYATTAACRQQMLCSHFTGTEEHLPCGCCDFCEDPEAVGELFADRMQKKKEPVEDLSEAEQGVILRAADHLTRPVGKSGLAKALRGSRAKALNKGGLLKIPEHGDLRGRSERAIVFAIDKLLAEGKLERKGNKYPTVWPSDKPVRPARTSTSDRQATRKPKARSRYTPVIRALDNYRRRTARALKWKPYMVFHRKAIFAIDKQRPFTKLDLQTIPGLGPAKIEKFGDDILDLVRRYG